MPGSTTSATWELFTSQWDRALERDAATVAAGPSSKLADLGWVFVVVAALGALSLAKRPFSSSFRGAAATWLGVTVVFAVIDTLSAIEIRYVLQALPLLALCAGAYLSKRSSVAGAARPQPSWQLCILFSLASAHSTKSCSRGTTEKGHGDRDFPFRLSSILRWMNAGP